jgi:hypothetical protein
LKVRSSFEKGLAGEQSAFCGCLFALGGVYFALSLGGISFSPVAKALG